MGEAAVIGFGSMGSGIAEVFAMRGFRVRIYEVNADVVKKNLDNVKWSLSKLWEKGVISSSPDEVLSNMSFHGSVAEAVREADVIIEAVFEDPGIKINVFREIEDSARRDALIASNTSGISITYLQGPLRYRDRFAGLHFFNPPVLMRLVEVIKGRYTSDETVERLVDISRVVGKEPIIVRRDINSFVANRVWRALRYNSFILYMNGVYGYREIDSALMYRLGLPMGVFALTDFTGGIRIELDFARLFDEIKSAVPDFEPHRGFEAAFREALRLASRMASEGRLGVSVGKGFYDYPGPGKWVKPNLPRELGEGVRMIDLLSPMINQAVYMVRTGVTTEEDIDKALRLGFNWPRGLFEVFRDYGKDDVVESLVRLGGMLPHLADFYEPDPGLR